MITDKGDYLEFYERNPSDTRKEETHQIECVSFLRVRHPELLFWHTVNEGEKTIVTAMRDEQAGLLKGVSDFVILIGGFEVAGINIASCNYPFAAIELKRVNKSGRGRASPVSEKQKEFLRNVRERGGFAAVAYGSDQFRLAIAEMLK